ncbi:MAG TPA: hypothetical protein VFK48_04500 [Usitatibacter sp.]|nr:hypothetical protein [Usitatibacter sp.]
MTPRKAVSAAELYVMLDREFRARRPPGCSHCVAPVPYASRRAQSTACNWQVVDVPECPKGCHERIAEMVAAFAARFDLMGSDETVRSA